jgi:two-component system, chemotaxis family, protein-glutamate methylesterase/glutaminase
VSSSSDIRRLRVLIVDDSRFARRILKLILAQNPEVEVIGEAEDGEEALRRIDELNPDLVTLDLDMPRIGGMDVLRRLRPQNMIPVVLVTALPELLVGSSEEVKSLNIAGIVNKTFSDSPMDLSIFGEELAACMHKVIAEGQMV